MSEQGTIAEVVSVGLVTPVGLSAPASSAAIHGGRSRARKSQFVGKDFGRQAMHLIDEPYLQALDEGLASAVRDDVQARMLRIGGTALAEALGDCSEPPALLLALPDGEDRAEPAFIRHLAVQAGVELDERASAIYRDGAGALFALKDALELLAEGAASVVVGGIDSFLDLRRLAALDAEGRLFGPSARLGFMPGEGAGFLLLRGTTTSASKRQRAPRKPALAKVLGVGTGVEKGHRYSKEPYRGDGLADALEALFEPLPSPPRKVGLVYAGFNGEDLPAKEWGVARLRNSTRFTEDLQVEHPADCIGDAGAALGAIMLVLATLDIVNGNLPQPRPLWATENPGPCLVFSTSDREPRAAALLEKPCTTTNQPHQFN